MTLGEIADVRSGLVLSRKKAKDENGIGYRLLNLRSINEAGYIDTEELDTYIAKEPLSTEYLTHIGDVVVRLTAPYTAVLIDEETKNIVISSHFIVIRAIRDMVFPGYLLWYLNTEKTKRFLYDNAVGNALGSISAKQFVNLAWDSISVDRQKMIADMNQLAQKEIRLLNQLTKEKTTYYTAVMQQIQENEKRGSKK